MAIFVYKALNSEGKVVKGKISARNEKDLENKLKDSSLDLISANEVEAVRGGFSKISNKELILICVHFYQLESAGVPILESVAELRDSSDSDVVRNVMMDVYDSLKNGKLLSQSLSNHPKIFDKVFCSLVAAGEKTGNFIDVFKQLENHFKWVMQIRDKIKKATYYPIFLFFLMMVVLNIMMIFVIPKLSLFLTSQNIALPWYTLALMATSSFILKYWYLLTIYPVALYLFIKVGCWYSPSFKYHVDSFLLKLPMIGIIILKIELSRFCHFFAITYKSGLGIIECIEVSRNVVQNTAIKEAIDLAKTSVSEGQKLNEAIKATGRFPSLIIRMFKMGEESGNLDEVLGVVNQFYDQEINDSVNAFVGSLQPILTFVMGMLLMWITISVFGPVYSSFGMQR